jgi:integrase
MPRKPVEPVETESHGQTRWRIFIPRSLTGGVRKTKWFTSRTKALESAKAMNLELAAKFNGLAQFDASDRAAISGLIARVGSVAELVRSVDFFLAHNPRESRTIRKLCDECLDEKAKNEQSKAYRNTLKNTLNRFCEAFGEREVKTLTAQEVGSWLNGGGWEAITREHYLTDIHTLFNFAIRNKYAAFNPALDVPWPKVTKKPPGIFTPDQCLELIDATLKHDPELMPWLALVLFGGFRPKEARLVEWSGVSDEFIDLPAGATKNNDRRLVRKTDALKAWLSLGGDLPVRNLKRRLNRVRSKTGLPWPHDVLRHSFCSYAVPIWGTVETARMADHSETVLKDHYLARVTKEAAEKFWSIMPSK